MTIQNEPTQAAIDAVNLGNIRKAQDANSSANGTLRGAFAKAQLQNLNISAAKTAIQLVRKGGTAIDDYFEEFKKVGEYLKLQGKELSAAQYELFGITQGPTPEDERAGIEGHAAGFKLDDEPGSTEESNPYPGSVKGNAWLTAFREARAQRNAVLAMPEPTAAAAEGEEPADGEGSNEEGEE